MIFDYILLNLLVLLCLNQFESSAYPLPMDCDKICAPWEGDKHAVTICNRRWKKCAMEQLYPHRSHWNVYNVIPHLIEILPLEQDVPCVDLNTKYEMDNTWCREYCLKALNETQIDVPVQSCREDTYCCQQPERPLNRLEMLVRNDIRKYRPEPNEWPSLD